MPITPEVLELIGPRLEQKRDTLLFNISGKPLAHTTIAKAMREASADVGTAIERLQEALERPITGYADPATIDGIPDALQSAESAAADAQQKRQNERDRAAWGGLQVGDEDFKPLTIHGLRHTAITALINKGVPVTTVARWAGHKSPTVTLDTYSHLYAGSLDDAAEVMADWLQT